MTTQTRTVIPNPPPKIDWSIAEVEATIPGHASTDTVISTCVVVDDHPSDLRFPATYVFVESSAVTGWDGVLTGVREALTELGCPPVTVEWSAPEDRVVEECGCTWAYRSIRLLPTEPTSP